MKTSLSYKGIIYRVFNSGSQDKVAYIILEEGSKLPCIAKSVKRAGSRKAHALEIGNLVNIKGLSGNLVNLTEVSIIKDFAGWKKDFKSMTLLQLILEIMDDFCYEDNSDPELYKILYNTLALGVDKQTMAVIIFLLKLLNHSGVLPELDKCMLTEEELNSENVYNIPGEVGYISDKSAEGRANSIKIDPRVYKTQRFILETEFKDGIKIKLSGEEEANLLKLELNWLESLMSVKIKSREILNSVI